MKQYHQRALALMQAGSVTREQLPFEGLSEKRDIEPLLAQGYIRAVRSFEWEITDEGKAALKQARGW